MTVIGDGAATGIDGQSTPTVAHLSRAHRRPLAEVLGGSEPVKMTPAIAANIGVLNEPLSCWMVEDSSTMEVNLLDRSLDILALAELPGTGEQIQVAIENQYGTADPDHFGRLVGWYMPESGAQMGVLVAEDFEPQLIKALTDAQIVRPDHGVWLVEATGFIIGSTPLVTYTVRASSLPRAERLVRERGFAKGRPGAAGRSNAEAQAEAERKAAALFGHIAQTNSGWLAPSLKKSRTTTGFYRWIIDNGLTCHVELFVGVDRVSVGSCYLKGSFDEMTLDALMAANQEIEVDPSPARRYQRGSWWDLRTDIGRDFVATDLPVALGDDIQRAIEAIRPAIDAHQDALKQAAARAIPSDLEPAAGNTVE
jgi:hypothetical protein